MPRQKTHGEASAGTALVFQYGIRRHGHGPLKDPDRPELGRQPGAYQLPQPVMDQIRLAHQMRNQLVELEHTHEAAKKALWSSWPHIADIETRLAEAEQQIEQLVTRARQEHAADRTLATRPGTAAELRAAQQAAQELRQQRRAAIGEVRDHAKPTLERLRAEHRAAIKQCRQEFAAAGLYWASYNAVISDHQVRVKLVERHRRAGRRAQLRFHRFRGAGTVAVQLQRQSGDPQRDPQLLASGEGRWRNVLQLRPWMPPETFDALPRGERRRVARTGELVMAIGTGGATVTLPVSVHRMMPAEADVAEATLTFTRIAGQWRASLSVTVKLPEPDPVEGLPPVALHCGWRQRPDGSVRVGTWAAPYPLQPPGHLAEVLVPHVGGRWGEIVLPASWLDVAGRPSALRGTRDQNMEAVKAKLASWLDEHPQPYPVPEDPDRVLTGGMVRQWRSPDRLAALTLRWRERPPQEDGAGVIVRLLEDWRAQDKHLWEWEAHERDQITRRRDNAWRQVSAWLTSNAGALVVDDTDMARLRRKSDIADDDQVLPGEQQQKARARAALAAPGRLRQLATNAATRRGVAIREVRAANLSRTCPHCGQVGDAHPRYAASAVVTCPSCVRTYDQDRSAAKLMLERERAGEPQLA